MSARLVTWVVVVAVLAGGCVATPGGDRPTVETGPAGTPDALETESYAFDHGDAGRPAIEGGLAYPEGATGPTRFYVTTVTSRAEGDRFDRDVLDERARAFVENTSFVDSYLVVVQTFPASSHPDYRVESASRSDGTLHLAINDSSRGGTADVTVETLLVRVPGRPSDRVEVTTDDGRTVAASEGVVTFTPAPTPTPEPTPSLPYAAEDPAENVDDPRDVRVRNAGSDVNGYRLTVSYCGTESTACDAAPVLLLSRRGKLAPGANATFADVTARTGVYAVTVEAEVPGGDGSRRTIVQSARWRVGADRGELVVTITNDEVTVTREHP